MRRFDGKAALVTGAAHGIGRATAARLAGEGARLVLADRDAAALQAVARELAAVHGADVVDLTYDAADGAASAAMADRAASAFGGLDCVVCNAGIYRRGHFAAIAAAEWDTVLAVNLTSVFRIVQAALPALRAVRGNVVTTASTAAVRGIAYAAHYAAAKAGLVGLTRSLAVECAPDGVRFNAVCPGRVKTGIATGQPPLAGADAALVVRPPRLAGRTDGGAPDDIAAAIAYLASSDAAYVSGSVLVVDGAQTIG